MRRNDILSGILLILSVIDLTLAAPVSAQEESRAHVDAVHVPKDMTTVLGKRGGEELEKLAGEYLKTWGKPVESSDAHALSSSAPEGPGNHGSTNVVQAPAPNPASSTANPDPLIDPSSCSSSTSSMHARGGCLSALSALWGNEKYSHQVVDETELPHGPTPSGYISIHELIGSHGAPPPILNPGPSPRPSTDTDTDSSTDLHFSLSHLMSSKDPPPTGAGSSTEARI